MQVHDEECVLAKTQYQLQGFVWSHWSIKGPITHPQYQLQGFVWSHSEEAGHPSRDNFLPIKFFAQHAYGGPR